MCVWVKTHLPISVCVCEWERTHLLICVYEWERELTSLPPFRPIKRRTNLTNRISDEWTHTQTLNPKPGHTQEDTLTLNDTHYGHTQDDTHYIEWYPLRTHPRGYPLHWVIPTPWVIFPFTDSSHNPPKSLPLTLRDPDFLTNKPDTERYPWHWVIPITLSSSQ